MTDETKTTIHPFPEGCEDTIDRTESPSLKGVHRFKLRVFAALRNLADADLAMITVVDEKFAEFVGADRRKVLDAFDVLNEKGLIRGESLGSEKTAIGITDDGLAISCPEVPIDKDTWGEVVTYATRREDDPPSEVVDPDPQSKDVDTIPFEPDLNPTESTLPTSFDREPFDRMLVPPPIRYHKVSGDMVFVLDDPNGWDPVHTTITPFFDHYDLAPIECDFSVEEGVDVSIGGGSVGFYPTVSPYIFTGTMEEYRKFVRNGNSKSTHPRLTAIVEKADPELPALETTPPSFSKMAEESDPERIGKLICGVWDLLPIADTRAMTESEVIDKVRKLVRNDEWRSNWPNALRCLYSGLFPIALRSARGEQIPHLSAIKEDYWRGVELEVDQFLEADIPSRICQRVASGQCPPSSNRWEGTVLCGKSSLKRHVYIDGIPSDPPVMEVDRTPDPYLRALRSACLGVNPWPLLLTGPTGTGKTTVAMSLRGADRVRCEDLSSILRHLGDLQIQGGDGETESSWLESIANSPILVVDNMDRIRNPTPALQDRFGKILDKRADTRLPTVFCSCDDPDRIERKWGEWIWGRVCCGTIGHVTSGPNQNKE